MRKSWIVGIAIAFLIIIGFIFFSGKETGMVSKEISETTYMGMIEPSYMDINVGDAKMLIDTNPDLIIIDVSPNYANGHLPESINYYVGDGSLDAAIPMLDKDAEYLVYCHLDSAAIAGATRLIDAGFTNVYRLEGNYKAWTDAGYPIEM